MLDTYSVTIVSNDLVSRSWVYRHDNGDLELSEEGRTAYAAVSDHRLDRAWRRCNGSAIFGITVPSAPDNLLGNQA